MTEHPENRSVDSPASFCQYRTMLGGTRNHFSPHPCSPEHARARKKARAEGIYLFEFLGRVN